MLRITKESEYAFLLLSALLRDNSGVHQNAMMLAETAGVSVPMSGKVLKRLVKYGLLQSVRGAHGGYTLTRAPEDISALEVVQAIEGSLGIVDCVEGETACALIEKCHISPFLLYLNEDIKALLKNRTLLDMQTLDAKARSARDAKPSESESADS